MGVVKKVLSLLIARIKNFKCNTNNETKVSSVFEAGFKPKTNITDHKGCVFNKPVEVILATGSAVIVKGTLEPGKPIEICDYSACKAC